MNNLLAQRVWTISAIVLSTLALVLAVLGIIGVWIGNPILSDMVVGITVSAEKSVQGLDRGVQRINSGVDNLRGEIDSAQQAVTQISQNVADDGLVRQLLPEAKEARLDNAIDRIKQTTEAVRDTLSAAHDLYQSVNRIPFVSLPAPDPDTVNKVQTGVAEIQQDVQDLKDGIAAVRAKQANAIARINTVTERADTRLANVQNELNQLSAKLNGLADGAKQLRGTLLWWITFGTIVLSLFFIWVIVSQVLVIRAMWQKWHTLTAQNPPAQNAAR